MSEHPNLPYPLSATGLAPGFKSPYVLTNKNGNNVENGSNGIPMSGDSGSYKTIDGQHMRSKFVRKVFFQVLIMLLTVAAMTSVPLFVDDAKSFLSEHRKYVFMPFWIASGFIYLIMVLSERARRFFPVNMILGIVLTLCIGILLMVIAATTDVYGLLMALSASIICSTGIVIFAAVTKHDLTKRLAVLFLISLFFGAFTAVTFVFVNFFEIKVLQAICAFVGTGFFIAWLAVDTQMLIGGKRFEVTPEDSIFVTIQLFVDAIFLFLYIIKCAFPGGSS